MTTATARGTQGPGSMRGVLVGTMVGDAFGAPYEFKEPPAVRAEMAKLAGLANDSASDALHVPVMASSNPRRPAGSYTDDAEMALGLGLSIVQRHGHIVGEHIAAWHGLLFAATPQRGYGPGAGKLLDMIHGETADFADTGRLQFPSGSFGNGGCMRSAVVGGVYGQRAGCAACRQGDHDMDDPRDVRHAVKVSIMATHVHPEAIDGAFLQAWTCKRLLAPDFQSLAAAAACDDNDDGGVALQDALHKLVTKELVALCEDEGMRARLQQVATLLEKQREEEELDDDMSMMMQPEAWDTAFASLCEPSQFGKTFQIRTKDAMATVLLVLGRWGARPVEALVRIVSAGGDTDTTAAILGALLGALHGDGWVPEQWLQSLERGAFGYETFVRVGDALDALPRRDACRSSRAWVHMRCSAFNGGSGCELLTDTLKESLLGGADAEVHVLPSMGLMPNRVTTDATLKAKEAEQAAAKVLPMEEMGLPQWPEWNHQVDDDLVRNNKVTHTEVASLWLRFPPHTFSEEQLKRDLGSDQIASACLDAIPSALHRCLVIPGVLSRWRAFAQFAKGKNNKSIETEHVHDDDNDDDDDGGGGPSVAEMAAVSGFANHLGRVTSYRALGLTHDDVRRMEKLNCLIPRGQLTHAHAACQQVMRDLGLDALCVGRLYLFLNWVRACDPSMSLHDDVETAITIAGGYATADRPIEVWGVSTPLIETVGWTLLHVSERAAVIEPSKFAGKAHTEDNAWFSHRGVFFDARLAQTERYVAGPLPYLKQRTVSRMTLLSREHADDVVAPFKEHQQNKRTEEIKSRSK